MGEQPGGITISRLFLTENQEEVPELTLTVKDGFHYTIIYNGKEFEGKVGELLDERGISLKVDSIDASPGTEFTVSYVSKLKAITDLQNIFTVVDQGKDTGMLTLTLIGDDPTLIKKLLIVLVIII